MMLYHSPHNRSGPTSSRRCISTLLNATRKYPKKFRICRLTPLVSSVRSALPKAEHKNFDVILSSKIKPNFLNTFDIHSEWIENSDMRFNSDFIMVLI